MTNGDSTARVAAADALVERVVVWRDVLHEGPVPDVGDAELRAVRAQFLGDDRVPASFEERDARARGRPRRRVRAVVRGRPLRPAADRPDPGPARRAARARRAHHAHLHRRVPRHRALRRPGRAAPRSARGPARRRGGHADRRTRWTLATRAWAALRAPDPRGLAAIVAARSPELRFMPEAFDRLGREYPWTRDGLSLTERRLLAAVAEGAATAGEAFVRGAAPRGAPVPRRHVGLRGDRAAGARARCRCSRRARAPSIATRRSR